MRALLDSVVRVIARSVVATLLFIALSAEFASAQTDVIRGRVIGVDNEPLAGVRVTATSIPGNVTRSANTNNQGSFQIAFPGGEGDYIMGYALVGYNFRQFQVKRIADEAVLVADARLSPVQLDSLIAAVSQAQRPNRNQPTQDVSGTERQVTTNNLPPEQQGNIAAMAASLPGVLLLPGLDGAPDGFSVLGLGNDANSVTLNGMQTGANGLPRDAGVSSSLTTSSYDVSRGGFSGGNFNVSSRSGSNFKSRGLSFIFTAPQLQWTDRAAQALGNDYTRISAGGIASGPITLNKTFYNVSFQFDRNLRDNQTLLNTSPIGLQTAGIALDSVTRFIGILNGRGIPTLAGPQRDNRVNDSGSVFGSIDLSPPNSSSGQSIGLNFSGNFARTTPAGGGATQLESAGGQRSSWGGGVQARHSGYLGLILSESSAGVNISRDDENAYLNLPSGRVRVNSDFADGGNGVQSLTFGGNQGLGSSSSSTSLQFQNALSWFDDANKHRLKLSTEVRFSGNTQEQASNLLGTFTFNSLADLEAGVPASFSRTLTVNERSTGQITASTSIGDSWRYTPNLQFQYGLRIDGSRYTTTPAYNALVESTFERRNDNVPSPISFSPRVGFSWTLGQANDIAMFTGAFRAPRAVLRGGIGVFSNNSGVGQIGTALQNTGLPGGVQQIVCVGPAVPLPNWDLYASDPTRVPSQCADGSNGTVFSNAAPNVTLFANDFTTQKTVRSNLSWNGAVLDARFTLNAEGTYSINYNQQRSLDLNFSPTQRFTLGDDGRPVFVEPTSIVSSTGSIASRDARVSQSFARVTELRSDLESRSAQLTLRLSPIPRGPTRLSWNAAYTYSNIRQQVAGFQSTDGNPLDVEWARSPQGPHSFNYMVRYNFFNAVQVSWNGSFRSGSAFTPTIAGDVNGDGYSNDRAFIFSPTTATDPALAAGMNSLLRSTSGPTRRCLEKQTGRIAERNSCRGPWTSDASLNVTLDRAKFRMPQRAAFTFSLTNPLGGADLLLNGSSDLKGWGQNATPDQSLLYVRGFDRATKRYTYEVNQRFGATNPQFLTVRSPVMLTASMRIDLGPTREEQSLLQQLGAGRSTTGGRFPEAQFRSAGTNGIQNPISTILRSQDSLRLSSMQADSIAAMNRRYTYRADSLWTPVARRLAALPNEYDKEKAYEEYLSTRRKQVDLLTSMVTAVRELLTPAQRRKLPPQIVNMLDPRYLALIRNGNMMYLAGAGLSFPGGGASDMMMMMGEAMVIMR